MVYTIPQNPEEETEKAWQTSASLGWAGDKDQVLGIGTVLWGSIHDLILLIQRKYFSLNQWMTHCREKWWNFLSWRSLKYDISNLGRTSVAWVRSGRKGILGTTGSDLAHWDAERKLAPCLKLGWEEKGLKMSVKQRPCWLWQPARVWRKERQEACYCQSLMLPAPAHTSLPVGLIYLTRKAKDRRLGPGAT